MKNLDTIESELQELLKEQKEKYATIDKNITDLKEHESELLSQIKQKEKQAEVNQYSLELVNEIATLKNDWREAQKLRMKAEHDRKAIVNRDASKIVEKINQQSGLWQEAICNECEEKYFNDLKAAAAKVIEISQKWVDEQEFQVNRFSENKNEFRPYLPIEGLGNFYTSKSSPGLFFESKYQSLGL